MGESQDIRCAKGPEGLQGMLLLGHEGIEIMLIGRSIAYAVRYEKNEADQGAI
jgi:hypothetical protein